jgi:hypothetical protein
MGTDPLAMLTGIDDNEANLFQLEQQLKSPVGVLPFIGAGLSMPFGFPGWGSFLLTLAQRAGIEANVRQRLDAGQYEEAAGDVLDMLGAAQFQAAIFGSFGDHRLVNKDHAFEGAVAYVPYLAAGPVITTNFDHVLERAFERCETPFEMAVWGARASQATKALQQNRRFLLKIHGDVDDATDRVITHLDYEKQYGNVDASELDTSKPLPSLLLQMLVARPLLFIGCSLIQDRMVSVLENVLRPFPHIMHFAIVERPAVPEMAQKRARFLFDHHVLPIWYPAGQHELSGSLLAYLTERAGPSWHWTASQVGQTEHFLVFSNRSKDGNAAAETVLETAETDYAAMREWFNEIDLPAWQPRIKTGTPRTWLPVQVRIDEGFFGAYSPGCGSTTIYMSPWPDLSRGLVAHQLADMFQAAANYGWDCSRASGHALSNVLAIQCLGHDPSLIQWLTTVDLVREEQAWWANGHRDYVTNNDADENDTDARACVVLFLYYLHTKLGFTWQQIITAGGDTLGQRYAQLTQHNSEQGFSDFVAQIAMLDSSGQLSLPRSGDPFTTAVPWP